MKDALHNFSDGGHVIRELVEATDGTASQRQGARLFELRLCKPAFQTLDLVKTYGVLGEGCRAEAHLAQAGGLVYDGPTYL